MLDLHLLYYFQNTGKTEMVNLQASLLIVEDDISSQQYYSIILDRIYDLCIVPTVQEAKAALSQQSFDLAIIDLSLPGEEDGETLIRYIRGDLNQSLPILVISAHAFPQNRESALQAGGSEFLTKPILSSILLDAIARFIKS